MAFPINGTCPKTMTYFNMGQVKFLKIAPDPKKSFEKVDAYRQKSLEKVLLSCYFESPGKIPCAERNQTGRL